MTNHDLIKITAYTHGHIQTLNGEKKGVNIKEGGEGGKHFVVKQTD